MVAEPQSAARTSRALHGSTGWKGRSGSGAHQRCWGKVHVQVFKMSTKYICGKFILCLIHQEGVHEPIDQIPDCGDLFCLPFGIVDYLELFKASVVQWPLSWSSIEWFYCSQMQSRRTWTLYRGPAHLIANWCHVRLGGWAPCARCVKDQRQEERLKLR